MREPAGQQHWRLPDFGCGREQSNLIGVFRIDRDAAGDDHHDLGQIQHHHQHQHGDEREDSNDHGDADLDVVNAAVAATDAHRTWAWTSASTSAVIDGAVVEVGTDVAAGGESDWVVGDVRVALVAGASRAECGRSSSGAHRPGKAPRIPMGPLRATVEHGIHEPGR